jgi:ABC-type sugar transport system ATPase subunit
MRAELAALHKRLSATMIYVTHDQTEAMTLADRIVVLRDGRIEQIGTPLELYNNPANRFVAGFIGSPRMNFIEAETMATGDGPGIEIDGRRQMLPDLGLSAGTRIVLGIRPHSAVITDVDSGTIPLEVTLVEQLGAETILHGKTDRGDIFTVSAPGQARLAMGERIGLMLPPEHLHVFDLDGQRLTP